MGKKCAGCRKENCDGCSLKPGVKIKSKKGEVSFFPEGFQADEKEGLGIAFDIGTTTVAGMLWDLEKGEILGAETRINPQRTVGSDIVGRIAYGRKREENRAGLQKILVEGLDALAKELCLEAGETEKKTALERGIRKAVAVGNTAMCEMLLGYSLEGLAKAPFHKEYSGSVKRKGKELGFSFLKEIQITVLPSIEGFVGADALSVYTYVKKQDRRKNVLAVDIGTNGEILLLGEEKSYACSAAAGPALEGAAVCQGMGAAAGAIEEVRLLGSFPRQDIYCRVIGGGSAKGICGSGLVDALAVLRKLKVIDETGCLLSRQEAGKAGVPERIGRRISQKEGESRILLTDEEAPVYLTAGDVRQLQLAKGAVRAGIEILLRKAGITARELNHIYLAGAFGSYIKIDSAVTIGLLPDMAGEKITHTGNCAGTGAAMALLSEKTALEMEAYAEEICHVELALEEEFQKYFLEFMAFN